MPHHGNEPFDSVDPDLDGLGKTGKFPEGKLVPHDEGELVFAITHKGGKVIIEFGTPVHWLGLNPDQAKGLAGLLVKRADEAIAGYTGLAGLTEGHPED